MSPDMTDMSSVRLTAGPPYSEDEMRAAIKRAEAPDSDNVDALADAVNRFHAALHESLGAEVIADVVRQFSHAMFERGSVTVHFTAGGEL